MLVKKTDSFLDKVSNYLFSSDTDSEIFNKSELEMLHRYRDAYTVWLESPEKTDRDIVEYLIQQYNISKTTAYRDMGNIKVLLGNVNNAGKEFFRHTANNMIKEGYQTAIEAESKLDLQRAEVMIKAAMVMGKVNKLDKEDKEQMPWEEIIPQPWEATTDVTVLKLKPIPDLEKKKEQLRKELGSKPVVIDINYEELKDGEK